MMNIIPVRFERTFSPADPNKKYADHIEYRNYQGTECNDECTRRKGDNFRIVHAVFNRQEGKDVSQRQTAGIAHEYFVGAVGIAEYVVVKEVNKNAEDGEYKQAVYPQLFVQKKDTENK